MYRMLRNLIGVAALCLLTAAISHGQESPSSSHSASVIFVCEHGSVKSLIAASLFERAARDRGLDVRALSRGLSPDERVPPQIAAALAGDGFDVADFKPQALSAGDIKGAARVISIGVDLPPPAGQARGTVQSWNDVPAASVDYAAARASLERHIGGLLDELESAASR